MPTTVRDERAKLLRVHPHHEAGGSAALRGCRAIRAGARSAARICPAFARSQASIRKRRPTLTRRSTFFIDNWRWAGVPFYIRTGKRLPKRVTDIAIQFNAPPLCAVYAGHMQGGRARRGPIF